MPSKTTAVEAESMLTVEEIAKKLLFIDRNYVTELFIDEPGVIVLGHAANRPGKRKYRHLRIPLSVYRRVVGRKTVRR